MSHRNVIRVISFLIQAGRITGVTLGRILQFMTGSDEEQIIGFSLKPSIHFHDLAGSIPTASTCVNMLYLPLDVSYSEEELFYKYSLAFTSDYFGRR